MPTAMDVANYFLATLGIDKESDLTHLKMQKLCAYAQGISIALLDRPLFEEELEAWKHGPVVPSLYEEFKKNGRRPIPAKKISEHSARKPFDDEQKFVLELAKEYYGSKSATVLRGMSHEDFPGFFRSKRPISKENIKERFAQLPLVKKLREYTPPKNTGKTLTEEEFLNALHS